MDALNGLYLIFGFFMGITVMYFYALMSVDLYELKRLKSNEE